MTSRTRDPLAEAVDALALARIRAEFEQVEAALRVQALAAVLDALALLTPR